MSAWVAETSFQGASSPSAAIDTTGANLIVIVTARSGSSAPTDNKGNTYLSGPSSPGPVGQTVGLYYCVNPTVGSGHTFQCADTFSAGAVLAFSGALSSPLDQTLIDSAERTPPTAAGSSLTPTQDDEIVIAAFGGYPADGAISINGGFSAPVAVPGTGGVSYGCAISYLIQTTATAANPTWTDAGGSGDIRILMASFKASASSPGVTGANRASTKILRAGTVGVRLTGATRASTKSLLPGRVALKLIGAARASTKTLSAGRVGLRVSGVARNSTLALSAGVVQQTVVGGQRASSLQIFAGSTDAIQAVSGSARTSTLQCFAGLVSRTLTGAARPSTIASYAGATSLVIIGAMRPARLQVFGGIVGAIPTTVDDPFPHWIGRT